MATLTFDGSTFWNNSTTGVGPVRVTRTPPKLAWALEPLPGGEEKIAKEIFLDAGRVFAVCQYQLSNSDESNLASTIAGKMEAYGSVVTPRGQTITKCILLDYQIELGPTVRVGSSLKSEIVVVYIFEKLGV